MFLREGQSALHPSSNTEIAEMGTHFFALRLCSLRSASRWTSIRASCCALRSAAVIRGTMSVKGFSTIRMPVILGGLDEGV